MAQATTTALPRRCAALAVAVFCGLSGAALAQTAGSSSAFGESVSIQVLPLLGSPITVSSGPVPAVAGSAPADYSLSGELARITVSSPALGTVLQAGLLDVDASSGVPATPSASADATVANAQLTLGTLLAPILALSAQAVGSTALVSGPCEAGSEAQTTGTTTLTAVQVTGPLGIHLSVPVQPAANTVLLDAAGVRVVLNEQIVGFDGANTSLTVNAVHISIDELPVAGLGALTADIILSQSQAKLNCSPRIIIFQ
jgi:hypothetical protein